MTWVWFLILGVVALANRRRIVGWISGWQRETLKSMSWIGLIFFGAMALFGHTVENAPWLVHAAAAAAGILALFTINEQIRRSSAVEAGALQRAIDQRRRREREERRQQFDAADAGSPARAAELLEEQAQQPDQPPQPEDSDDLGRYVVIQVDESDNVRGVAIGGAPQAPPGSGTAPGFAAEADAPAGPQPPPLIPVDEPVEVENGDAEEEPAAADAAQLVATGQQPRPAGPVSLGGGGTPRASGPIRLTGSAAPAPSGPVSLRTEGVKYQPQVDRSRLAAKPDKAPEPPAEDPAPLSAEQPEAAEE